uniref:Uncharacterized protein n=1 Tax=Zosterops lateralis melanops TaxID=1220523 RepID=A0A8D2P704_ZOSLA
MSSSGACQRRGGPHHPPRDRAEKCGKSPRLFACSRACFAVAQLQTHSCRICCAAASGTIVQGVLSSWIWQLMLTGAVHTHTEESTGSKSAGVTLPAVTTHISCSLHFWN